MTTRTEFTEQEGAQRGRAPLVAAMAISLADPGGPIEALKETGAALKTVLEAAQNGGHGELVRSAAQDVAERTRHRDNPMAGFRPTGAHAREEILHELRAVNSVLVAK